MIPDNLFNWMLVFIRISAMFSVFPLLSGPNFPVQLRIGLSALVAYLVAPMLPLPCVRISMPRAFATRNPVGIEPSR